MDSLYATSSITSPKGLKRFLERDTTYNLIEDPAVSLSLDLIVKYYEMNQSISEVSEQIEQGNVCSALPCAVCMPIGISIRMPIPPCGSVSERLGDILLLMEPLTIIIPP